MGPVFPKKVCLVQNRKNEYQRTPHNRISLVTKFHLKKAILDLWTKIAQKGNYFQSKTEK